MATVYIDIETYCEADLTRCGVYKYAAHPSFDVILYAWTTDGGAVNTSETLDDELAELLADPGNTIVAHNAMFERVCLSRRHADRLPRLGTARWRCSMVQATVAGYPPSLHGAAQAMRLPVDKMTEGRTLIPLFCMPDVDGRRTLPERRPAEWSTFVDYCRRDVEVCRLVWLASLEAAYPGLWEEYAADASINDRGVAVDIPFTVKARDFKDKARQEAATVFNRLTGGANARSGKQVRAWLSTQGVHTDKTDKKTMEAAKRRGGLIESALEVRETLAKSSLAKYDRIDDMEDGGRIRGLFQFYGASRTGRFAGRGLQPQNFPRNVLPHLEQERAEVKAGDWDTWRLLHDKPAETLSQLLRTAFVPAPGHVFAVADWSAVEARVLAWLAGERWRQKVFAGDGRIYEATAAAMFGVPANTITKDSPLRARGKIADLALGYGGGPAALVAMGAEQAGLKDEELPAIVRRWRSACPAITRWWDALETAAANALRNPGHAFRLLANKEACVRFRAYRPMLTGDDVLEVTLPSGRRLHYVAPTLELVGGRYRLRYMEESDTSHRWTVKNTYGGKLAENVVSATCRDLLTDALRRLETEGFRTVMHVHDEVVCEAPAARARTALERIEDLMCTPPVWATGLALKTSGFTCDFYRKD